MENWDEIRTAAEVARQGTIKAAAEALGVHRATVNRHLDALETRLCAKLFLRHARGLTPTELGEDLLRVATATQDQFSQLERRAKEKGGTLSGDLVITVLGAMAADLLPIVKQFHSEHPRVRVRLIASESVLKLEYGQAHIAIRAGKKPEHPDNVVIAFQTLQVGLHASTGYVEKRGLPASREEFGEHVFVGTHNDTPRASFLVWMAKNVPSEAIRVRCNKVPLMKEAIVAGLGIGFLPESVFKKRDDLVEVLKPHADWLVSSWIVTHVDVHRSTKVQAFLKVLKSHASPKAARSTLSESKPQEGR